MKTDILTVVARFASQHCLFDTGNLIVGLSGGPDSVALITILAELRDRHESFPNLLAVHVNHNLRDNAKADEELARRCAQRLNVPFYVRSVDVRGFADSVKRSEEESGRILRYQAFDDVAHELLGDDYESISRIAVAHHRGDLAETVMMNLFRGSGLEGLVSPEPLSGRIIRPLLCISKEDILDLLRAEKIEYATDETNFETDHTRNKWRNELLPAISKVSVKEPEKALADTYDLLSYDLDYIRRETDSIYERLRIGCSGYVYMRCGDLTGLHPAILSRVIRKMWMESYGDLVDFERMHLAKVRDLISDPGAAEKSLDLGRGRQATTAAGYLVFCHSECREDAMCGIARLMGFQVCKDIVRLPVSDSKNSKMPKTVLNFETWVVENNTGLEYNDLSWVLPIYPDDTEETAFVNGLPDVVFRRAGTDFGKKVSDLLADLKVPREARAHVVMAVRGNDALWIPGVGHAVGYTGEKSYKAWISDPGRDIEADHYIAVRITDGLGMEC